MTLRGRVLLAQAPLALALAVVGVLAVLTLAEIGRGGQEILADNYRSVLAAQRMKEAIERIDSAALFAVIGEREAGLRQAAENRPRFEAELQVEEQNITEPGEQEAAVRLRQRWTEYQARLDRYLLLPPERMRSDYIRQLEPQFEAVKGTADEVLALNQDAMVRRSEALKRRSDAVRTITVVGVLAALLLGLVASSTLTTRALRPLGVLGQAVRRVGEGDLGTRVTVEDSGEIGQLARDFNAMADSLRTYRDSSLGELLEAQQGAQAAIDSLPDPVLVFGADGGLLNVNTSAERVLGIRLEGEAPLSSAPPAVRRVIEQVRGHVLSGKGAYSPKGFEEAVSLEAADGVRALLPRATPVAADAGQLRGATVVLQDVTRLRRFDQLKSDMVATVAHEFRTPLTSLRMAIHLCLEETVGVLNARQLDLLGAAREDCERLQSIVDDLLDLSRIQSGRLELQRQEVRTGAVTDSALALARPQAEDAGLALVGRVLPGAESAVLDPERISLVLQNLLGNAIRHTPRGGRVELAVKGEPGGLRFSVQDTGEGIAREDQARIFEKFYRVPGRRGGSAGLGLSIAREVVDAHGGKIGVTSTPGLGSTFWFTVPEAPAAPPEDE